MVGKMGPALPCDDMMEDLLAVLTLLEVQALCRTNLAVDEAVNMYIMIVAPNSSGKITIGRNFITADVHTGRPIRRLHNAAFDVNQHSRFVVHIMGFHIESKRQMAQAIYAACHPSEDFNAKEVPLRRLEFVDCSFINLDLLPSLIELFPKLVSDQAECLANEPGHTILRTISYQLSRTPQSNDDPADWSRLKVRPGDKWPLTKLISLAQKLAKDKGRLATCEGLKEALAKNSRDEDAVFVRDALIKLGGITHGPHKMTTRAFMAHVRMADWECSHCDKMVPGAFYVGQQFHAVRFKEEEVAWPASESSVPVSQISLASVRRVARGQPGSAVVR
ncbi:unnamed protein product [Zymoseptoria tritici ST99CH_3D7]|uniref:Uncharacterized protein n=1 Tax=Zymoseptoria tritici (strain ST99CH_3D7) TaxID=1276538 RepID=A0A1X7S9C4_ZYMT9|nr:unnamed protein product [Zymoseptoria tritici ST99CH_3D7]